MISHDNDKKTFDKYLLGNKSFLFCREPFSFIVGDDIQIREKDSDRRLNGIITDIDKVSFASDIHAISFKILNGEGI